MPGLTPDGLTGAVRYYDGFTNDARLTLDTLRSAAQRRGDAAELLPVQGRRSGSDVWECDARRRG